MGWAFWIAVAALVVSGFTAWATLFGPKRAAELAEDLRVGSTKAERREHAKQFIFYTLMQERGAPYTIEAVKAFNLIDVAYVNCPDVREAWQLYFASLDASRSAQVETRATLLHGLLMSMANELGLAGLKLSDISRTYSPNFVVRKLTIEDMQGQLQEGQLKAALAANAANTTPSSS